MLCRRSVAAMLALALALLALAACQALPVPLLVPASTETLVPNTPCDTCDQATQLAVLTQANINANAQQAQGTATANILVAHALATSNAATATQGAVQAQDDIGAIALQAQAAATADILRVQALATFNAASSTQGAAQTQDRLNASALQAAAAATAEGVRAQALATFNSASSTQSSALTQAAVAQAQAQLHLRLAAQAAKQSAAATGTRQWMGVAVAGTATTLARAMIDQTQSAATLAQQAADRRQAQNQGPIDFMWKWGLPIFIVAIAGLGLWGLWRWLRLHTARPRTVGQPAGRPVIIRERVTGLAESLPKLLRWIAWFVETRSTAPAPAGPPRAVVVIDTPQNPQMAATPEADLTSGPAPDEVNLAAPPVTPGATIVEAEASLAGTQIGIS